MQMPVVWIKSNTIRSVGTLSFGRMTHLSNVFFPSLATLGGSSFQGCTSLKYLKLGQLANNDNLKSANTFHGCPLIYVALYLTEIPSWVAEDVKPYFPNTPYVYVPDEFLNALEASTSFASYSDKMRPLSELEADALANGWDY